MRLNTLHYAAVGLLRLASANAAYETQQPLAPLDAASRSRSIDDSPLLSLHRSLVQTASVTGNEASAGDFLVSYLEAHNLTVHKQYIPSADGAYDDEDDATTRKDKSKARFNIYAHAPGHRHTRALLTSHYDTVPPFYNYSLRDPSTSSTLPANADITSATEIHGRGTADAKSCVAAMTTLLTSMLDSGALAPSDAALLFVVGEETGGDGMRAANALGLSPDAAVVFGEPTEGKLVSGHKGMIGFKIEVRGQAAHSGYPWLGRSANEVLVAALAGLQTLQVKEGDVRESEGLPTSEKYGTSTLNIGRVDGGVAANVVAERAFAGVSVRLAGGKVEDVKALILRTIEQATKSLLEDGKATLEVVFNSGGYPPVDIDSDVKGFEKMTVNYGTDIPNWHGKQKKRYLYGPGSILVAHSDHEHLTVGELEQSVEDYKKILKAALKD